MIAVDTNLLVYAHRRDYSWHDKALEVVTALAQGRSAWALPWPCVHEFLAVTTNPRIFKTPSKLAQAADQVEAWLASPSVVLLSEGAEHWSVLRDSLERGQVRGAQVHDARVAALCQQHGVRELWTADRDFSRFAGVKIRNPLVA